jgi:transketolase
VAILSTGALSHASLVASRVLSARGRESIVLHVPTVKPLDEHAVLAAAQKAGRVLTIEEHQTMGGFGSAIAEFLGEKYPVPIRRLGVRDQFGQSGTPDELLTHYGLDAATIEKTALELIQNEA